MPETGSNKIKGKLGEQKAAEYLQKLGYKILERNYRYSRYAEIDIIAKDKDTIVFAEVKTRTNTAFGHPFEAVNHTKIENIFKAALSYLKNTKESYKKYRIDVISVVGDLKIEHPKIEHLKNIELN